MFSYVFKDTSRPEPLGKKRHSNYMTTNQDVRVTVKSLDAVYRNTKIAPGNGRIADGTPVARGETVSDQTDQKPEAQPESQPNGKAEKTEKDASKFNWVTERSSCSLPNVFKTLKVQVEEDVQTRNGLRPKNSPYEFSVADRGGDFTVLLEAKGEQRSVTFTLAAHAIQVRAGQGDKLFDVTLTFNDQGECKLNVDEKERDLWQVRRMALEDLFFVSY